MRNAANKYPVYGTSALQESAQHASRSGGIVQLGNESVHSGLAAYSARKNARKTKPAGYYGRRSSCNIISYREIKQPLEETERFENRYNSLNDFDLNRWQVAGLLVLSAIILTVSIAL